MVSMFARAARVAEASLAPVAPPRVAPAAGEGEAQAPAHQQAHRQSAGGAWRQYAWLVAVLAATIASAAWLGRAHTTAVSAAMRWARILAPHAATLASVGCLVAVALGTAQHLWRLFRKSPAARTRSATSGDPGRERMDAPGAARSLPQVGGDHRSRRGVAFESQIPLAPAQGRGGAEGPTAGMGGKVGGGVRGARAQVPIAEHFNNPVFGLERMGERGVLAEQLRRGAGSDDVTVGDAVEAVGTGQFGAYDRMLQTMVEMRDYQREIMERLSSAERRIDENRAQVPAAVADPPTPRLSPAPITTSSLQPRRLADEPTFDVTTPPPSPLASRQPHQLADGRWELGTEIHSAIIKSSKSMVQPLQLASTYGAYKAWESAVEDWICAHCTMALDTLGPAAVRAVGRLAIEREFYNILDQMEAFGSHLPDQRGKQVRGDTTWGRVLEGIQDKLACSDFNLQVALTRMRQETTPAREFARAFEQRARDAKMEGETAKAHLVANLNHDTLQRLDAYVTMHGGEELAKLETMESRLRRVPYSKMIGFLKQGNLVELAQSGSGGGAYRNPASKPSEQPRRPLAGSTAPGGGGFGFASAGVMAVRPSPKCAGARVAAVRVAEVTAAQRAELGAIQVPEYTGHMQSLEECSQAAEHTWPKALCLDPMPALAATIGILRHTHTHANTSADDKGTVESAMQYLGERLAALTSLVDKSAPSVNMLADVIPRAQSGRRRGASRTLLFDVAKGLARRIPLTKLVELDGDVRPYMAALMVAALARAGEALIIPEGLEVRRLSRENFDGMLAQEAGKAYDNYGAISRQLLGIGAERSPEEVAAAHRDRVESKMGDLEGMLRNLHEYLTRSHGSAEVQMGEDAASSNQVKVAVVKVASQVEGQLLQLLQEMKEQPRQAASTPKLPTPVAPARASGALSIRHVRGPNHKLASVKPRDESCTARATHTPHIEVVVEAGKTTADAAGFAPSRGLVMIDTGAAVSVVSEGWLAVHGLRVKTGSTKYDIVGAGGNPIETVGLVDLSIAFGLSLAVELGDVVVRKGEDYCFLLGSDFLAGKSGVLGAATVQMGGWDQVGYVTMRQWQRQCLAYIPLHQPNTPAVGQTTPAIPDTPAPTPLPPPPTVTFDSEGVRLSDDHKEELRTIARARDSQRATGADDATFRQSLEQAKTLFRAAALPNGITRLLRGVVAKRFLKQSTEATLAQVLGTFQRAGLEAATQKCLDLGVEPSTTQYPKLTG